jgi:hypothetical protein
MGETKYSVLLDIHHINTHHARLNTPLFYTGSASCTAEALAVFRVYAVEAAVVGPADTLWR